MFKQLDAHTLRLLWYETKALYDMGRYLAPPRQPAKLPSPQDTSPQPSSATSFCASTPSPESLTGYSQFGTAQVPTPTDPVVQQALLEAFLVHYRILAEFLCKPSKSWEDQILASEFACMPSYPGINAQRDLCDKWLSHLSCHRHPPNKPAWDYPKLFKDIMEALRNFLKPLAANLDTQAMRSYREIVALSPSLL